MNLAIYGFTDSMAASRRLGTALGVPALQIEVRHFPDRESLIRIPSPARTAIFYRSLDDPDRKLIELLLAASAARDQGTVRIILVAPYLAYMRQDKAFHPGEAISQKVICGLISDHFDALLTVDPHLHRVATLAQVVPRIPAISVSAAPLLATLVARERNPIIIGPDSESRPWTESLAAPFGLEVLIASKQRTGDRRVSVTLDGIKRAHGRHALLVDDVISTGQTLIETAKLLHAAGAVSVEAVVTHCLARPRDLKRVEANGIGHIASSDTIDGPTSKAHVASLIGNALRSNGLVETPTERRGRRISLLPRRGECQRG